MSKNPVFHKRFKHIKIRYHYHDEEVEAIYIPTNEERADILIKFHGKEKFSFFNDLIGLYDVKNINEIKGDNAGK